MGIFDKFKSKPKAPLAEPDSGLDMNVDLPPPPPIKDKMEIPSFPKFSTKSDYVPELPKLSEEPSLSQEEIEIPLPPQAEITTESNIDHTQMPDISPIGLDEPIMELEKPMIEPEQPDFGPIIKRDIPKKTPIEPEIEIIDIAKPAPEEFSPAQHIIESGEKEIYIEIRDYKDVLDEIATIRKSLSGLNVATIGMKELKDKENTAYNSWQKNLEEMKKKFLFIDNSLFSEV